MGANIVSTQKNSDGLLETTAKTAGQTAKGLTEMTFLQGVSGALGALTEPERKAQSFAGNAIGSLIPSIVGAGARTLDPIKRETQEGLLDPLKNRIPGLKETLPVKRDIFGQEQQFEGNQFFSPARTTTAKDIPFTREVEQLRELGLDVTLTKAKKKQTIGGLTVELTPEELDELRKTEGTMIKTFFNDVLNNPAYRELNAQERAKLIQKGLQFIRDTGKQKTLKNQSAMSQIQEGLQEKMDQRRLQAQSFYTDL
jgi:hypothetical protein